MAVPILMSIMNKNKIFIPLTAGTKMMKLKVIHFLIPILDKKTRTHFFISKRISLKKRSKNKSTILVHRVYTRNKEILLVKFHNKSMICC